MLFHLISCLSIDEHTESIMLLALPLARTAFDLLDLFVFEALLQALFPELVSYGVIIIFCETVVSKVLSISIVPVEHLFYTSGLFLTETLFTAKFRFEFGMILFDQIKLHHSLIFMVVMESRGRFSEVMEMLGISDWDILLLGNVLQRLGMS